MLREDYQTACTVIVLLVILAIFGFALLPDNAQKMHALYEVSIEAGDLVSGRNEMVTVLHKLRNAKEELSIEKANLEDALRLSTNASILVDSTPIVAPKVEELSKLEATIGDISNDLRHSEALMRAKEASMREALDELVVSEQQYRNNASAVSAIDSSIANVKMLLGMVNVKSSAMLLNDIKILMPNAVITDVTSARIALQAYLDSLLLNRDAIRGEIEGFRLKVSASKKKYENSVRNYTNFRDIYLSFRETHDHANKVLKIKNGLRDHALISAENAMVLASEAEVESEKTRANIIEIDSKISKIDTLIAMARQKYMALTDRLAKYSHNSIIESKIQRASLNL